MKLFLFSLGTLALLLAAPHAFAAAEFTPLTSLPGLGDGTSAPDLPAFLNQLYKISIGIAATLAVLQIVRGGITYMMGDSITEKRTARQHITMALLGLVLVLSPAIVFGLIDPRILDLDINTERLAPTPGAGTGDQTGTPGESTGTPGENEGEAGEDEGEQATTGPQTQAECEATVGGVWRASDSRCVIVEDTSDEILTEQEQSNGVTGAPYTGTHQVRAGSKFVTYQTRNVPEWGCRLLGSLYFEGEQTTRQTCEARGVSAGWELRASCVAQGQISNLNLTNACTFPDGRVMEQMSDRGD